MVKRHVHIKFVVIVFPLVFLWAGLNFNRNNYPNDPAYIYLMNALCICDGQSVGHIDNPGTTLMQLSAGVIELMHAFSRSDYDTVIEHVIKNPNKFIEGIRVAIVFLNTLILFFLGWFALKRTRSIWAALFLQISTFFSAYVL